MISDQACLVKNAESESCEFAKPSDGEDAFVSVSQREHETYFSGSRGTEELGSEIEDVETWVLDSAASRRMAPNSVPMTNYRECDDVVRVTNGIASLIEGIIGDIIMSFSLTSERSICSFSTSLSFLC